MAEGNILCRDYIPLPHVPPEIKFEDTQTRLAGLKVQCTGCVTEPNGHCPNYVEGSKQ